MKVVFALVVLALSCPVALAAPSCERELDTLGEKVKSINADVTSHAAGLNKLLATPKEQITIRMVREQRRQTVRLCSQLKKMPGLLGRFLQVARKPACKGQITTEAMNNIVETRSKTAAAISQCAESVSIVRDIERGMKAKQRKPGSVT